MSGVIVCTLLLSPVGGALAQHAGLNVTLESVKPTPVGGDAVGIPQPLGTPLESIIGIMDDKWVEGKPDRDLYKFSIEWGAPGTASVGRNFSQRRVQAKDRPFGTALQERTQDSLQLTPFGRMSFSMSRDYTETTDLGMISLGATRVEAMGLTQGFGGGDTAGTLSFTRKVTEKLAPAEARPFAALALTETKDERELKWVQGFGMMGQASKLEVTRGLTTVTTPGEKPREQATDAVRLDTTLWAQTALAGVYEQSRASEEMGLHSQHRGMRLARPTSLGDTVAAYDAQSVRNRGVTTDTITQSFRMPLSIDGTPFTASFDTKTVERDERLMSDVRKAAVATKLAGHDVTGTWDRSIEHKSGQDHRKEVSSFSLPFAFLGQTASFTHQSDGTQIEGAVQKKTRTTSLALPLAAVSEGASFSYVVRGAEETGKTPHTEVRTARLLMPLSFSGTSVNTELMRVTTHTPSGETRQLSALTRAPITMLGREVATEAQYVSVERPDGSEQDVARARMAVPFKPGPLVVQRTATTDTAPDGEEAHTRVLTVAAPRVPVHERASVQADMELKDLPDGEEHRTTHFNVQTQPATDLTVSADYRIRELGTEGELTERRFDASYALGDRLSLNARYLDREQLDKSPHVQRTMMLERRTSDPAELRLRAGMTATDAGDCPADTLHLVEMGFGDPRRLGVSLKYQEYDDKKLTELGDPIIHLGLQSGDPRSFHWEIGYEDFKDRAAPRRHYGVGLPIGDTSLRLALRQNEIDPTDPKRQRVRVADLYDAGVSSRVFGDVDLDLSYRYCEYPESAAVADHTDQWWQVKLSGGRAEAGGAIQLGYASGDFVPLAGKPERTPTSTLSLRYEKRWNSDGALSLNLQRTTVPEAIPDLKDSYEGRLQFEHRF